MFKTYDPMDVNIIIGGVHITGFGDDMVEIEPDEDKYELTVGAQGDVIRTKINNDTGTIKLTLLMNSPQVAYMDSLAKTGKMVSSSVIYNGFPKETSSATESYVKKPTARKYGKSAESREYEIQCIDLIMD